MGRLERVDSMAYQGDISCTEISLQSKFEEEVIVDEEMDDEVQQKQQQQQQHQQERNHQETGQLLIDQGSKCNESDTTDEQFLSSSVCTTYDSSPKSSLQTLAFNYNNMFPISRKWWW